MGDGLGKRKSCRTLRHAHPAVRGNRTGNPSSPFPCLEVTQSEVRFEYTSWRIVGASDSARKTQLSSARVGLAKQGRASHAGWTHRGSETEDVSPLQLLPGDSLHSARAGGPCHRRIGSLAGFFFHPVILLCDIHNAHLFSHTITSLLPSHRPASSVVTLFNYPLP